MLKKGTVCARTDTGRPYSFSSHDTDSQPELGGNVIKTAGGVFCVIWVLAEEERQAKYNG